MQRIVSKFFFAIVLIVLAVVSHYSVFESAPYIQNQGLKTEARNYIPETCKQVCTVSMQGDSNRATATLALLDNTISSIPPGSLSIIIPVIIVTGYIFLYVKRQSFKQRRLQQEFCIWRF